MGFAYAQGMVDELKPYLADGVTFGRHYILAPENACSATNFDKTLFEEVWQYGSNEEEDNLWEQDGIAPQCAVPGLSWGAAKGENYGRIPIPSTDPNRDFLGAHSESSYGWIFESREKGEPGYVKKR